MTIQLESELSALQQLSLQDFSYSRLDTYSQCHLKYFFTYILKEDRVFGPAAALGNIIHQALEYTLEPNEPINAFELMENYNNSKVDFDPDSEISEALYMAGETMLHEFIDRHKGESFNIYAKEMEFSLVIGGGRFNGFIDRVDILGDTVHICDYKSGKVEVANKDIATNLQLGIYALVASYLFPDKKIYAELYYLRNGKRKGHLFSTDDLVLVENKLTDLVQQVLNTHDFKPTPNESACHWCDFAKNGTCSAGVKRLAKKYY